MADLRHRRHAGVSTPAEAQKTRRPGGSLRIARLSITSLICAVMWLGPAAQGAPNPTAASEADQRIQTVAQETTDPTEDDSTDTTEGTGTTDTTGSSETTTEAARTATASWWQWLLGAALVIGAASVITLAANRPPDSAAIGLDAQSLLAHYQEVTASVVRTTPSRGYAYELGVLDTLSPRLDDLIDATQSDARQGLLVAVRSRSVEAVEVLRATEPEGGGLDAQLRITEAGAALEQAIQRARAEF